MLPSQRQNKIRLLLPKIQSRKYPNINSVTLNSFFGVELGKIDPEQPKRKMSIRKTLRTSPTASSSGTDGELVVSDTSRQQPGLSAYQYSLKINGQVKNITQRQIRLEKLLARDGAVFETLSNHKECLDISEQIIASAANTIKTCQDKIAELEAANQNLVRRINAIEEAVLDLIN